MGALRGGGRAAQALRSPAAPSLPGGGGGQRGSPPCGGGHCRVEGATEAGGGRPRRGAPGVPLTARDPETLPGPVARVCA